MSIKRDVIADVLHISEEQVNCENCVYAKKFVGDAYVCDFWDVGIMKNTSYCSFFKQKGEEDE